MSVYADNSSTTQISGRTLCGTGGTAAPTDTNVTCTVTARYLFAQFVATDDGYLDLCQVQVWGNCRL